MSPRTEILANIVRLTTAGCLIIAQAAVLYAMTVVNSRLTQHRPDCPFSRPWWHENSAIPEPSVCPHCVWSRIHSFNLRYAVVGWLILAVAILSLVAFAATD